MNSFSVNGVCDIINIPPNVNNLRWNIDYPIDALRNLNNLSYLAFYGSFNQPIDALQNLNNLTHIQFLKFYDFPFKLPSNIHKITLFNENDDFFSPLYINYSEYLVRGDKTIKVGLNKVEFILNDNVYVKKLKLIHETDLIKEVHIEDITYDEIEEFLSPGMNLKPAKN